MAKKLIVILEKDVVDQAQAETILSNFSPPDGSRIVSAKIRDIVDITPT